jgi:hypothetical protein
LAVGLWAVPELVEGQADDGQDKKQAESNKKRSTRW